MLLLVAFKKPLRLPHVFRGVDVHHHNGAVHLLLLDLESRGLSATGTARLIWPRRITKAALYDSNWLAVYEANVKNWITGFSGSSDYVAGDHYFNILKANKVSFYNPRNTLVPPLPPSPPPLGVGPASI